MEENIMDAGSEVAEEVVEQAVENMDGRLLKYLGVAGIGAVVGIMAYRKLVMPAYAWVRKKRGPKFVTFKTKKAEEADKDNSNEETEK